MEASGRYRLTPPADRDIETVLRESARMFGSHQRKKYGALIVQALEFIARDPLALGTKSRADILPGLRSFHIERIAMRRGAASHILYYEEGLMPDGAPGAIISTSGDALYAGTGAGL